MSVGSVFGADVVLCVLPLGSETLINVGCSCAKGGGRKHSVWRIRPYIDRDSRGKQRLGVAPITLSV